ncbi:lysosomal acid glucosylceramidase-like isoform X2 [Photinus pyralis]|uniref:lysosomal acid glucosylceramidase-like isoform X2 n=1 Tax=Photinus pyralis TaxID=7054 RepID=UPI00126704D5|nr:lysosomal acid glucosylceramidase-like isoform X2 [Photinus pyralis]
MKFAIILAFLHFCDVLANQCAPRSYGYSSVVCVCNASYCDNFPPNTKPQDSSYFVYTTTEGGLRLLRQSYHFHAYERNSTDTIITIDSSKRHQTIIGWGGAFTDSTGININSLSEPAAATLLRAYYSDNGLQYNMGRVPIGGTDFSTHGYSYNDGEEDPKLLRFNLTAEDFSYKIPLIKQAQALVKGELKLLASAWTAPKWMKRNGMYTGPDFLKDEMYQAWANYFVKFLRAYATEKINFWGLTTGNEPSTGLIPSKINSVGWLPGSMGTFIAENLGPTIRKSEFASIKLLTIDDQLFMFPKMIEMIFKNEKAKDYIDGFGLHYYWNWLPRTWLKETHDQYPEKFILATESCEGVGIDQPHVKLGDWKRAENYASDIIKDLNNWVTGWIDWNMALDLTGGPTYIDNNVDAPIIVNSTAGEFYKQPMYYALAHFSKFLPEGSQRISFTQTTNDILVTSFIRPDGAVVVTILNPNLHDAPIRIRPVDNKHAEVRANIPTKSIVTIVY